MKFFDETVRRDPREHQDIIFVFGSNLAGIHGAGAAAFANYWYGAERGIGVGPTGKAYAIPTKDAKFNVIPLDVIGLHVWQFLLYAKKHPELNFFVTRIGCGYAGYSNPDIAPMFRGASDNCMFEQSWKEYILPVDQL
jgi:hypothetical protein